MNTTDEVFLLSFHKNYKLGPTRNILFARMTSNEPICIEGWNKFSVPIWSPWEPNLTHRRSGCQLGLLLINFDFRNVIFQPMVFPFVWAKYKWKFVRDGCIRRPLAARFARPNRRACSQARGVSVSRLQGLRIKPQQVLTQERFKRDVTECNF